jgi:hypothetical protein
MKQRHYNIRKDGRDITMNNGFILLGCIIGNLIMKQYLPVLILAPFALLMFVLAWVEYSYGK